MSEIQTPGGDFDKSGPREPSILDTAIAKFDRVMARRLELKLEEYRQRYGELLDNLQFTHPDFIGYKYGYEAYGSIFRIAILEGLLKIGGDEERNYDQNPVVITELALYVRDNTGINVTPAATVPFKYDEAYNQYAPNYAAVREAGNTPQEGYILQEFAQAYGLVRAYASGDHSAISGGTGLPESDLN